MKNKHECSKCHREMFPQWQNKSGGYDCAECVDLAALLPESQAQVMQIRAATEEKEMRIAA